MNNLTKAQERIRIVESELTVKRGELRAALIKLQVVKDPKYTPLSSNAEEILNRIISFDRNWIYKLETELTSLKKEIYEETKAGRNVVEPFHQ